MKLLLARIIYKLLCFIRAFVFFAPFVLERSYKTFYLVCTKCFADTPNCLNYAIYDLRSSPITYDFVHFLGGACYHFSSFRNPDFALIIVTDNCKISSSSPWDGYSSIIDREKMRVRIFRLLIPLASLFSRCRDNVKLVSPSDIPFILPATAKIFPLGYSVSRPVPIPYTSIFSYIHKSSFVPDIWVPCVVRNSLDECLHRIGINVEFPFLTLTLRSYNFQQNRNTSAEQINTISRLASLYKLPVVLVPDSDSLPTPEQKLALGQCNFHFFFEPALDVLSRVALYKKALINFMNLNGPMCIAILSMANSYIMNFDALNIGNSGAEFSNNAYGILPGSQPYKRFGVEVQWASDGISSMENFVSSRISAINDSKAL